MRAHLRAVVHDRAGNVIENAAVHVYQPGTTTPVTGMWDAPVGGAVASSPLISNDQGEIEAWLETAQTVDLLFTDNDNGAFYPADPSTGKTFTSFTESLGIYPAPEDLDGGGGGGEHPGLAEHDALGLATQAELNAHTHNGLAPAGGLTGQVLKKTSGADYTYGWAADETGGGGGGDDDQTAAEVPFAPTGSIAAANVQAALAEVDAEKVPLTDARLTDQRVPTDGSVTNAKVDAAASIAESKLSLASDAAAGTASRRTLGAGSTQAAAGNHTHVESLLLAFSKGDEQVVAAGTHRLYAPGGFTWTIAEVRASVGVAPTGSSLIVDVHKSGVTIFTTQSNRPQIAAGDNTDLSGTIEVNTLANGEYLTVDIDAIGSALPGEDLTVQILLTRNAN